MKKIGFLMLFFIICSGFLLAQMTTRLENKFDENIGKNIFSFIITDNRNIELEYYYDPNSGYYSDNLKIINELELEYYYNSEYYPDDLRIIDELKCRDVFLTYHFNSIQPIYSLDRYHDIRTGKWEYRYVYSSSISLPYSFKFFNYVGRSYQLDDRRTSIYNSILFESREIRIIGDYESDNDIYINDSLYENISKIEISYFSDDIIKTYTVDNINDIMLFQEFGDIIKRYGLK